MKKLLFSGIFCLLFSFSYAQVTLSPAKPGFTEEVTLTYRADEGNAALKDCACDVYAHTGIINELSASERDWKKVVSNWGENMPKLKLTRTADNVYELKFRITELYAIPPAGNLTALAFVFRNADGSKVGKTKDGNDIYYYFRDAAFRRNPETLPVTMAIAPEWAKHANIYEVNVRQYTQEGTLKAFEAHLPRLKAMGVNMLWFMPIQPIGKEKRKGPLGSYYSIQDYMAVNPEFGTMDDFKRVVQKCHGMGIKVILDWVGNHSAWDNAWAQDHPAWYVRDSVNQIVSPFDWTDVAKLNYDHYYMRRAMIDAMAFWVREVDIDGFRCDVAGEVAVDFWEDAREKLDAIKPMWMIAENADQHWLMNRAFNANYGWPFHHLMNTIAKGTERADAIYTHLEDIEKKYPKGCYPMQFITNHDENSWNGTEYERLGEGHQAFAVLTYMVPGIPLIYSGQEAGLNRRLKFFDKDPITWTDTRLMPFYTQLNALKAENPALWNGVDGGPVVRINNDKSEKVVSFGRKKELNQVVLLNNLSGVAQTAQLEVGKMSGIYTDYFTKEKVTLTPLTKMSFKPWEYRVLIFTDTLPKQVRTFQSVEPQKTGLNIKTSDGLIRLSTYSSAAVGVEFLPYGGEGNPPSYATADAPVEVPAKWTDMGSHFMYELEELSVKVDKNPFKLSYFVKKKPILEEEDGFFDMGSYKGFRFKLNDAEKLTGGGERVLGMNRRGKRLKLYGQPSYGYETQADVMYYSMPVVVSSEQYMVVFDNGASGFLDMGATEKNILQMEATGGRMSYLVVAGDTWPKLMQSFTALTGRQPLPALWTLGNISARMGYHTQKEVESVATMYRKERIPLDALVLDLYWFGPDVTGSMGNLDWHYDSFPKPVDMMRKLRADGIKTVLITEPFVLDSSKTYRECIDKGLVGTDGLGKPYHYNFFFGRTTLLDVFAPKTKDWFWNIYKKHTASGVEGWWGDLGEPEVHPKDLRHINGSADEVHNLYGHEWAKLVYDGFARDFPSKRPVILMRSGFGGSQRYGMIPWSGDVNRSWGGLRPQVEISLTMGLQGMAYMHSDLGGFAGSIQDPELYTRWLQYGVFQPVFRTHAQESVPPEPIYWDETTKNLARKAIELRYRLLPYNYTLAYQNATTGMPLMRPLFFEEAGNASLFDTTSAYMWGDNFLVAPVTTKAASKKLVYLPKSSVWIDYATDKVYEGGQTLDVTTDPNHLPIFVKAGAFIPYCNLVQSTDNYSLDTLLVHYYHHSSVGSGSGVVYHDDGHSKDAIKKGQYDLLTFSSQDIDNQLNISVKFEQRGLGGDTSTAKYLHYTVHGLEKKPAKIFVDNQELPWTSTAVNGNHAVWNGKVLEVVVLGERRALRINH